MSASFRQSPRLSTANSPSPNPFDMTRIRRRAARAATTLSFVGLEQRQVLTTIFLDANTLTLRIVGDNTSEQIVVDLVDANTLSASSQSTGTLYFDRNSVQKIDARLYDGDDSFTNNTDVACRAWGFAGNDVMIGGSSADVFDGGAGADQLNGEAGDDTLLGGTGNDLMYGGVGNDYLSGASGDDVMFGDDGYDRLFGFEGNDTIHGGMHGDYIRGGTGNDALFGDNGADRLIGESGDDVLRGGLHMDRLYGGVGNDSLFGGYVGDADVLFGNEDADRFLTQGSDIAKDVDAADAEIVFQDFTRAWSDEQIGIMDEAFQKLFDQTGNNRLLRDSLDPNPLKIGLYSNLNGAAGLNSLSWTTSWEWVNNAWQSTITYEREIKMLDWNENIAWQNDSYRDTILHEIGHNWDSEEEMASIGPATDSLWQEFLDSSGWTETNPNDAFNYSQSADGQWWYVKDAHFAWDYGRTNPHEDWATTWAAYFDANLSTAVRNSLASKFAVLDTLFASA